MHISRFMSVLIPGVLFLGLSFFSMGCSSSSPSQGEDLWGQIQQRQKILAGVKYDSKPFGFLDKDGKVKGYDIDLVKEIAKRLLGNSEAVEFQQVLSSTRVMAINSGNLDVVAATMTITPEREELIDFSKPYYVAGQAVMVPKNSPVQHLDQLKDKRVLFVFGSTSEGNLKKRLPQAKTIGFKTATDGVGALKAGRGEAFTTDDTILLGFMDGTCDFRLLPERISQEPYGLGIKQDVSSHSTDTFKQKINEALAQMEKDGTLGKIRKKWILQGTAPEGCPG
ncbi:MAG: transporter substrate-binding domain-containing protein [Cyanobacteria bacterium]|nr:transporter substrate-binding domain-containing protein [Cyanobacteriota bacterium]